jgi:hypothetical protein
MVRQRDSRSGDYPEGGRLIPLLAFGTGIGIIGLLVIILIIVLILRLR